MSTEWRAIIMSSDLDVAAGAYLRSLSLRSSMDSETVAELQRTHFHLLKSYEVVNMTTPYRTDTRP